MGIENRKATVSLVMIVRNEEARLAQCLEPIAGLFDEIVIVDTGSVDGTKDVARRFTSRVFDFAWCDDFSAARNESLRLATGDWVMWLDADDRLSAENIERLSKLLGELDQAPRAYLMDTACWSEFACEGITLISHPRLFSRHADLRWEGRVHEQLRSQSGALHLNAVYSEVRIDHYGYTERATLQRKLQRNVRLLRMDYAVDPERTSTLLHLGLSYFQLGRWDDARACFTRLLEAGPADAEHLRQVFGSLAHMAIKEGDIAQALRVLEQGLIPFADDEYLLYLQAECLYELDRYDEAIDVLNRIVASPAVARYHGGDVGDVRSRLAPRKLADVLRLKRQFGPAESLLLSLLQRYPQDTHSWHGLGRVYLDWGQREGLFRAARRLRDCPQGDIFAAALLALWHMNQGELMAAGEQIEWLIAHAPLMPLARVLRVDWLTRCGASLGDRIHACRDVLRLQPGNLDVLRVLRSLEAAQVALSSRPMVVMTAPGVAVPPVTAG